MKTVKFELFNCTGLIILKSNVINLYAVGFANIISEHYDASVFGCRITIGKEIFLFDKNNEWDLDLISKLEKFIEDDVKEFGVNIPTYLE